jgi:hypothetical protein
MIFFFPLSLQTTSPNEPDLPKQPKQPKRCRLKISDQVYYTTSAESQSFGQICQRSQSDGMDAVTQKISTPSLRKA